MIPGQRLIPPGLTRHCEWLARSGLPWDQLEATHTAIPLRLTPGLGPMFEPANDSTAQGA